MEYIKCCKFQMAESQMNLKVQSFIDKKVGKAMVVSIARTFHRIHNGSIVIIKA